MGGGMSVLGLGSKGWFRLDADHYPVLVCYSVAASMENYHVLELVGTGSFGKVYKGRRRGGLELVALKFISIRGRNDRELALLQDEIEIMKTLDHPHIIKLHEAITTKDELARPLIVATDYAAGELYQVLEDDRTLPIEEIHSISQQLISALRYLHDHRIIHRDLKPQNVLLGKNGLCMLCDFGFARAMSFNTLVVTSIKGTPLYMSPELVREEPYDHRSDLWGLGCILYELCVGEPPFYTNNIFDLVKMITQQPVTFPSNVDPDFKDMLQGLLIKVPHKRLGWPHLSTHRFLVGRRNIHNIPYEPALNNVVRPKTSGIESLGPPTPDHRASLRPIATAPSHGRHSTSPSAPGTKSNLPKAGLSPRHLRLPASVSSPEPKASPRHDSARQRRREQRVHESSHRPVTEGSVRLESAQHELHGSLSASAQARPTQPRAPQTAPSQQVEPTSNMDSTLGDAGMRTYTAPAGALKREERFYHSAANSPTNSIRDSRTSDTSAVHFPARWASDELDDEDDESNDSINQEATMESEEREDTKRRNSRSQIPHTSRQHDEEQQNFEDSDPADHSIVVASTESLPRPAAEQARTGGAPTMEASASERVTRATTATDLHASNAARLAPNSNATNTESRLRHMRDQLQAARTIDAVSSDVPRSLDDTLTGGGDDDMVRLSLNSAVTALSGLTTMLRDQDDASVSIQPVQESDANSEGVLEVLTQAIHQALDELPQLAAMAPILNEVTNVISMLQDATIVGALAPLVIKISDAIVQQATMLLSTHGQLDEEAVSACCCTLELLLELGNLSATDATAALVLLECLAPHQELMSSLMRLLQGMAVDDDAYAWTLQALVAFVHQPSWSIQGEPELGFYSRVMQQLQQLRHVFFKRAGAENLYSLLLAEPSLATFQILLQGLRIKAPAACQAVLAHIPLLHDTITASKDPVLSSMGALLLTQLLRLPVAMRTADGTNLFAIFEQEASSIGRRTAQACADAARLCTSVTRMLREDPANFDPLGPCAVAMAEACCLCSFWTTLVEHGTPVPTGSDRELVRGALELLAALAVAPPDVVEAVQACAVDLDGDGLMGLAANTRLQVSYGVFDMCVAAVTGSLRRLGLEAFPADLDPEALWTLTLEFDRLDQVLMTPCSAALSLRLLADLRTAPPRWWPSKLANVEDRDAAWLDAVKAWFEHTLSEAVVFQAEQRLNMLAHAASAIATLRPAVEAWLTAISSASKIKLVETCTYWARVLLQDGCQAPLVALLELLLHLCVVDDDVGVAALDHLQSSPEVCVYAFRETASKTLLADMMTWLSRLMRTSGKHCFAVDKLRVFPEVVRCLRHESATLRARACNVLGNAYRHSAFFYDESERLGVASSLISLLTDQHPDVLKFSAFAIGNLAFHSDQFVHRLSAAIPHLVRLLSSEQDRTISNAAGALGNLGRNSDVLDHVFAAAKASDALLSVMEQPELTEQTLRVILFTLGTLAKWPDGLADLTARQAHARVARTIKHRAGLQATTQQYAQRLLSRVKPQ
ncbi:uncharacterized protein MONBRDRAFT_29411 [Monosiga brevicollis MX1]|uniref:non-specific serine/threonine protein kinase n=1 Tax=Monosiga brevicollis TaxID=81824 RepID=A9VB05_MONBE|nr:uncharacterized protein MONBRDRAFT_29411 [Monosiga brevicollis MX1]EDQ85307.1 predicted protein [Monosiga brevicollis MX1]|eukprot:XP_001749928.1 hypothetical protein [Monosiga brevicollis MX1]